MTSIVRDLGAARPSFDVPTLRDAFTATALRCRDQLAIRRSDDSWRATWTQYQDLALRVAHGLVEHGVGPGETVALLLMNRPEVALADCAALHIGAVPFSIYATSSAEQLTYILSDADTRIVITEPSLLPRLTAIRPSLDRLEHIFCIGADTTDTASFEQLATATPLRREELPSVRPNDIATLVYTSGTTGPPKGVQITHANILAQLRATDTAFPFVMDGRCLSYLPLAHIGDRVTSYYRPMVTGSTTTFHPDPRTVTDVLPAVRPTEFLAVPRFWQKLRAELEARFDSSPGDVRADLQEGLRLGVELDDAHSQGRSLAPAVEDRWRVLDARLFAPIRAAVGLDQAAQLVSSAAPIDRDTLTFHTGIGLHIYEAYGLTEASGGISVNPPGRRRPGTVGTALPTLEVALAEDGELLARGPTMMAGYRHNDAATSEAIDRDGWLHTGDIATIDGDGYITIIDRKKDLIINAAGKNMSSSNIENCLTSASALIGCAVCIGDRRPFNTALITLEPAAAAAFAAEQDLPTDIAELSRHKTTREAIAAAVERANDRLSRVEQIKRFVILPEVWLPGSDQLTPTMKLRRKPILELYADAIENLYTVQPTGAGVGDTAPTTWSQPHGA